MINRQNWLDVNEFLKYDERVKQLDADTLKRHRTQLRHLLEWADKTPFPQVRKVDPTFPVYLHTARNDGKDKALAPAGVKAILNTVRLFFAWALRTHGGRYRTLSESWVDTLRPSKADATTSELKEHEAYALEDVLKLLDVPGDSLKMKRDKAATAFLFVSGMRIDAFVTLPLSCVDVAGRTVRQLPRKGVRTKNSKAAETYLLDIPPLLKLVAEWDGFVRETLADDAMWYASLSTDGEKFTGRTTAGKERGRQYADGLKQLCELAKVEYLSPHKLRHGHAVYAIQNAKTIDDLKAVSQNLMHASLTITDAIYSMLKKDDVKVRIAGIGRKEKPALEGSGMDRDAVIAILKDHPEMILDILKGGK